MAQKWGLEVEKEWPGESKKASWRRCFRGVSARTERVWSMPQWRDKLPGALLTSLPIKEQEHPLPIKPRVGRAVDAARLFPHAAEETPEHF